MKFDPDKNLRVNFESLFEMVAEINKNIEDIILRADRQEGAIRYLADMSEDTNHDEYRNYAQVNDILTPKEEDNK